MENANYGAARVTMVLVIQVIFKKKKKKREKRKVDKLLLGIQCDVNGTVHCASCYVDKGYTLNETNSASHTCEERECLCANGNGAKGTCAKLK